MGMPHQKIDVRVCSEHIRRACSPSTQSRRQPCRPFVWMGIGKPTPRCVFLIRGGRAMPCGAAGQCLASRCCWRLSFVESVAGCEPHVRTIDVHRCFAIIIIAITSTRAITMALRMDMGNDPKMCVMIDLRFFSFQDEIAMQTSQLRDGKAKPWMAGRSLARCAP